jgi:hypothetical protein
MKWRSVSMACMAAAGLLACGEDDPGKGEVPGEQQVKAQANTVAGQVLDERGAPVADALVSIWPAMFEGYVETHSDAQGLYRSVELSAKTNPYYVQAYKAVTYHGRRYCLRLAPTQHSDLDAFNASQGVVRNWRWKLTGDSGEAPDVLGSESWGGSLKFDNHVNMSPDSPGWVERTQRIEVTLAPTGPLIDGSTGQTLVKQTRVQDGLGDLPVGQYMVTVSALEADGSKTPLKVSMDYNDEQPGTSAELMFDGFEQCGHSGTFVKTALWLSR